MKERKIEIKNIKDNIVNDAQFIKLLTYSHYNPTNEKLSRLTKIYNKYEDIFVFGAFDKDSIIGFIVVRNINKQHKTYEIIDIATVLKQKQMKKL